MTDQREKELARFKVVLQGAAIRRRQLCAVVESITSERWARHETQGAWSIGEAVAWLTGLEAFLLDVIDGAKTGQAGSPTSQQLSTRPEIMRQWDSNEARKADWAARLTVESAEQFIDFYHDRERTRPFERWEMLKRMADANEPEFVDMLGMLARAGFTDDLLRIFEVAGVNEPGKN